MVVRENLPTWQSLAFGQLRLFLRGAKNSDHYKLHCFHENRVSLSDKLVDVPYFGSRLVDPLSGFRVINDRGNAIVPVDILSIKYAQSARAQQLLKLMFNLPYISAQSTQ